MRMLTKEQRLRLERLLCRDDLEFYERFLMEEPLEVQQMFQRENSAFMKGYPGYEGDVATLSDEVYRHLLRRIKKNQEELNGEV